MDGMSDLRPQIAIKIKLATHDHAVAFPAGDWRGINDRLSALRLMAMNWDPSTMCMGNEMCAEHLKRAWAAE